MMQSLYLHYIVLNVLSVWLGAANAAIYGLKYLLMT